MSESETPQTSEPEQGSDAQSLYDKVIGQLKEVYDPEIPINIYELGLIYHVEIQEGNKVHVVMTLTTPHCPEAQSMPGNVREMVEELPEVPEAHVEITWEPRWDMNMMSDEAKLQLGLM